MTDGWWVSTRREEDARLHLALYRARRARLSLATVLRRVAWGVAMVMAFVVVEAISWRVEVALVVLVVGAIGVWFAQHLGGRV